MRQHAGRKCVGWMAVVFLLASWVRGVEFHVAPGGRDSDPGTSDRPLATIEGARDTVRPLRGDGSGEVVVYVHDGVYRLKRPIQFDARDSGRGGQRVIYVAAPGAHPIVTGGRLVSGWTIHDADKGIFKAQAGKELFRQVYINGELATRARYPNASGEADGGPYLRVAGFQKDSNQYVLDPKDWPATFGTAAPADLELVTFIHWRHQRARYGSHVVQDGTLQFGTHSEEQQSFFGRRPLAFQGCAYYLENALALLDVPGEWYHDPADGTLYYKPPAGQSMEKAEVEVPSLATLIEVTGTAADPVRNLEFRELTFQCSNWTNPSTHGIYATQFAQPYTGGAESYPPGIIRVTHADHFALRNNIIRRAGGNGVEVCINADEADIEGNTLYDIGCNAIVIDSGGKKNPSPETQSLNVAIWNNDIHHTGRSITNGGAILANFVRGLAIEHNRIHDMPYSGIQVGNQPGGYKDCGCGENRIRWNLVYNCMQLHDDGGGIYTLGGQQRGTEIAYNFVHSLHRSQWTGNYAVAGFYLDNRTQFVSVHDNVFREVEELGRQYNKSKDNLIKDNVSKSDEIEKEAGIKRGYNPRGKGAKD